MSETKWLGTLGRSKKKKQKEERWGFHMIKPITWQRSLKLLKLN